MAEALERTKKFTVWPAERYVEAREQLWNFLIWSPLPPTLISSNTNFCIDCCFIYWSGGCPWPVRASPHAICTLVWWVSFGLERMKIQEFYVFRLYDHIHHSDNRQGAAIVFFFRLEFKLDTWSKHNIITRQAIRAGGHGSSSHTGTSIRSGQCYCLEYDTQPSHLFVFTLIFPH